MLTLAWTVVVASPASAHEWHAFSADVTPRNQTVAPVVGGTYLLHLNHTGAPSNATHNGTRGNLTLQIRVHSVTSNWTVEIVEGNVTLAPGESATIPVQFRPPAFAAMGARGEFVLEIRALEHPDLVKYVSARGTVGLGL